MLFASFPPLELSALAWIALVPVVCLAFFCTPGKSFIYGFLAGAVFWLSSIFWLTRVTFIGWFFISLYCALYVAFFALVVSWWSGNFRRVGTDCQSGHRNMIFLFGIPAIWVGMEYARAHLLTGFPWNLLGISQHASIQLIQCADWGGVYLVSYLLVMGNTAVAMLILNRRGLKTLIPLLSFLLIFVALMQYGKWRISRPSGKQETMRTAAVQPNVPQQLKWSKDWADEIYARLKKATADACLNNKLDLIVWPETALPDFIQSSGPSRALVNDSRRHGVPLLAGSMHFEERPGITNYFNSSFLYLPGTDKPQVYAKRHLVIFGEYVPLGNYLPFLRSITDIYEDFVPGREIVVFRLNGEERKFSALICFEDIFPYLARDCVLAGARLLINQTNDAWFDPSWASRQHMTHCVFRCVENRVACLRAANTGLTCYIDRNGAVRSMIAPIGREQQAPQVMLSDVEFSAQDMPLTFFTRHGDLFALACLAFSLPLFAGTLLHLARKSK